MTLTEMETRIEELEKLLGDKGQNTFETYAAIESAFDNICEARKLESAADNALDFLETFVSSLDSEA